MVASMNRFAFCTCLDGPKYGQTRTMKAAVGLAGRSPFVTPSAQVPGISRTFSSVPDRITLSSSNFAHSRFRQMNECALRSLVCRASTVQSYERYLQEVACSPPVPQLDMLLRILQAQDMTLMAPEDRINLHPLAIPLASNNESREIVCLLRWPEGHRGMELPLVAMARGANSVRLLARSVREYCHRALVEEDYNQDQSDNQKGQIALAAGKEAESIYQSGDVKESGLPSLEAYITRKVGMFCDVSEALALNHKNKGDAMSALITAEWYMRPGNFPDWARPYEFTSELLREIDRTEEARDMARISLQSPWWSLQKGFEAARNAAEIQGNADDVLRFFQEQEEMANGGALKGMYKTNPKSEKEKRMEEAAHLLNKVAAEEADWESVRIPVADLYADAGLGNVALFVRSV